MADLLPTLIVPDRSSTLPNNGSQESFFSSNSQRPSTPPPAPAPASPPSNTHTEAIQAAGLPVYDVDTYFNDPKSQALLVANAKNTTTNPAHGTQPGQSGMPKTSHFVPLLNVLCQKRAIVPEFKIDGDQFGFGGCLKIGNETVCRDERWPSKRDAKEALAERGVELVHAMQERGQGPVAGTPTNWVGLLQAFYHSSIADASGPLYMEFVVNGGFASTCTIPSNPDSFGSASDAFPTKKAARANAAREAMNYLIEQGAVNPDGSLKPKKAKLGTPVSVKVKVQGKQCEVKRDTTFAQRVNDLCPILGLQPPTYRLSPSPMAASNLLSGAAYFPTEPQLPDQYGEVRNIFGKKAAKEECARGVWEVLRALAAKRGVNVGIEDETDERGF